jgi:ribonucleotide reductase alpha subunit
MASHRQKAMGSRAQGQSVNLYITADETEEDISRLHNLAFKDEWLHGLYYVQSQNKATKIRVDKSVCDSCEG